MPRRAAVGWDWAVPPAHQPLSQSQRGASRNVRLAVQVKSGKGFDLFSRTLGHRELIDRAMAHLADVSLAERATAIAATLPHADQRKLEVAILLALEPDIFMFDEPTRA